LPKSESTRNEEKKGETGHATGGGKNPSRAWDMQRGGHQKKGGKGGVWEERGGDDLNYANCPE